MHRLINGTMHWVFFLFLLFRSRFGLGRRLCSGLVNEFDIGHQGRVALSWPQFDDPAIPALATRRPRSEFSKQSMHRVFLTQKRKGNATCVEITPFAQSDHPLSIRSNSLCFCQSCLDSIVCDEAANLVCQQQIPMLGFPAQFDRLLCVTHSFL
jgi:hypothetical protein